MARLLEGIRVLDFSQIIAGPYAAMLLGDLGAEVIRVESTKFWPFITRGLLARPSKELLKTQSQAGYPQGEPGERPWNRWMQFVGTNRNKLSFTVDLGQPKGRDILFDLVRISDVFLDGNRTGVAERFGITYEALKRVNPRIIFIRISGYGASGPYREFPALAFHIEGFVGHAMLRHYPDMDPSSNTMVYAADAAAGAAGALAVLLALFHRRSTGEGQYLELSMAENFVHLLSQAFMDHSLNGHVQAPRGNRHPSAAQGVYRCRGEDRWVAITIASDRQWEGFCRALGDPEWARAPEFGDVLSRHRHHDELDAHIQAWARERDHYEVMHLLQRHGVPAAVVADVRDEFQDPHLRARGFFEKMSPRDVGTYEMPGIPWKLSRTPLEIRWPSPALGEHNAYVYKELLGISDEEYARLEKEGHIGEEPDPSIP